MRFSLFMIVAASSLLASSTTYGETAAESASREEKDYYEAIVAADAAASVKIPLAKPEDIDALCKDHAGLSGPLAVLKAFRMRQTPEDYEKMDSNLLNIDMYPNTHSKQYDFIFRMYMQELTYPDMNANFSGYDTNGPVPTKGAWEDLGEPYELSVRTSRNKPPSSSGCAANEQSDGCYVRTFEDRIFERAKAHQAKYLRPFCSMLTHADKRFLISNSTFLSGRGGLSTMNETQQERRDAQTQVVMGILEVCKASF